MDIRSFFTSIDQSILYNLVAKKTKNEEILWLTRTIIFHDCAHDIPPKIQSQPSLFAQLPPDKSLFTAVKGKGLPIGNLTSQFFANVYLDQLDQFVKHTLRIHNYLRYVDDFIILGDSYSSLETIRQSIAKFVAAQLGLRVHPQKQIIRPISDGIDFVGFIVRPEYVLLRRRTVGEWLYKAQNLPNGPKRQQALNSYRAQAAWANTYYTRACLDAISNRINMIRLKH